MNQKDPAKIGGGKLQNFFFFFNKKFFFFETLFLVIFFKKKKKLFLDYIKIIKTFNYSSRYSLNEYCLLSLKFILLLIKFEKEPKIFFAELNDSYKYSFLTTNIG